MERTGRWQTALGLVALLGGRPAQGGEPPSFLAVEAAGLRVESGSLSSAARARADGGAALPLRVTVPELRAVARSGGGEAAELAFRYLTPTTVEIPLGNGERRRQIGLKLRAQDTCNLVYVMWRLEPQAGIFVSVKWNPGQSTHEQCRDGGYLNLKPAIQRPAPAVAAASLHTLRAVITGDRLVVTTDGALAWEGTLPPEAARLAGPVGLRSDNGEFELELRALQIERVESSSGGVPRSTRLRPPFLAR